MLYMCVHIYTIHAYIYYITFSYLSIEEILHLLSICKGYFSGGFKYYSFSLLQYSYNSFKYMVEDGINLVF